MPSENEAIQQGKQEKYGGVTFDYLDDEQKEEERGRNGEGKEEEEGGTEKGTRKVKRRNRAGMRTWWSGGMK